MKKILIPVILLSFLSFGCGQPPVRDYEDLITSYMGDADTCQGLNFECPEGELVFFDETGCGCMLDEEYSGNINFNLDDLETYSNNEFEFLYPPSLLQLEDNKGGLEGLVELKHRVKYSHLDPCDMRKKPEVLSEIEDFTLLIKMQESLEEALKYNDEKFTYESLALEYYTDGELTIMPGFIDQYSVGSLNGYKITSQVEYCGVENYYFPITDEQTLVVSHPLTEIEADLKLKEVDGVISTEKQQELFEEILSSIVIK